MRTIVYIDGFNLYYGACRAPGRRWLDPLALAQRLLPKDDIVEIAYFTANIKRDPEDPGAQDRQRLYHRALRTIPNLEIFLGRYISKRVRGELIDAAPDELSRRTVLTYEEKGTDVNRSSLPKALDWSSPRCGEPFGPGLSIRILKSIPLLFRQQGAGPPKGGLGISRLLHRGGFRL